MRPCHHCCRMKQKHFMRHVLKILGEWRMIYTKYLSFMCLPSEYTCTNFRKVMTDPDLSMFICKDYIDLMLRAKTTLI